MTDKVYYYTQVVGQRGAGKTTLLAKFAVDNMIPPLANFDIRACKAEIQSLRSGGCPLPLKLESNVKHLVYVVDDIFTAVDCGYEPRTSMELSFEDIGLYDGERAVKYLYPNCKIFLPEFQSKIDCRKSMTDERPTDSLLRFIERQRKNGIVMFGDSQLYDSLDKRFRLLADRVIEVLGQEHTYNAQGVIKRTIWNCMQFEGAKEYEHYLSTGKGGTKKKYEHKGNIFDCVDSFAGKEHFYVGMTGNYDGQVAKPLENDWAAMQDRAKRFTLFKPKKKKAG